MLPVSWRLKEEGFEIISRTSRRYPGDKQFGLLNKIREAATGSHDTGPAPPNESADGIRARPGPQTVPTVARWINLDSLFDRTGFTLPEIKRSVRSAGSLNFTAQGRTATEALVSS